MIYEVPGIGVSEGVTKEFSEEFETICPECTLRTVKIHAEALGNTAPTAVVSDLESHPETNVAVFAVDEIEDRVAGRTAGGRASKSKRSASPRPRPTSST